MPSDPPVSTRRLEQITQEACASALSNATDYIHSQTESWNNTIVQNILSSLLSAAASSTATDAASPQKQYKYVVNSTIIQHLGDPISSTSTAGTSTDQTIPSESVTGDANGVTTISASANGDKVLESGGKQVSEKDRRGMHSATGAYWNEATDGMWNFKWEGGDATGMDVVISVIWVAV